VGPFRSLAGGAVVAVARRYPRQRKLTGVRTTGLRWALEGETLEAGSSRGVSNVFAAPEATVSLESGVILAIRP